MFGKIRKGSTTMLDFYCPQCGRKTSYKEEQQPHGKKKECKGCNEIFWLTEINMKPPSSRQPAIEHFADVAQEAPESENPNTDSNEPAEQDTSAESEPTAGKKSPKNAKPLRRNRRHRTPRQETNLKNLLPLALLCTVAAIAVLFLVNHKTEYNLSNRVLAQTADPEILRSCLPASLPEMPRESSCVEGPATCKYGENGEAKYSYTILDVSGYYKSGDKRERKPEDSTVTIRIHDLGSMPGKMAVQLYPQLNETKLRHLEFPFYEDQQNPVVKIVIGYRFVVEVEGERTSREALLTALAAIDLSRLRQLAGSKK